MPIANNRILIVEDDVNIRTLMARHFTRIGFEVEMCVAAEEATARFGEALHDFDVVVTDVHLPGNSGVDLARSVRRINPNQPIVFMTGDADETIARTALKNGAVGYLIKPFEFFEVDALVHYALEQRQIARNQSTIVRHPPRHGRADLVTAVRAAAATAAFIALAWLAGAGLGA